MIRLLALSCMAMAALQASEAKPPALDSKEISLAKAIDWAHNWHPSLQAAQAAVSSQGHRRDQAGRWPNPRLHVDNKNLAGSRNSGWDNSETTMVVSQRFELGGKRSARQDQAGASTAIAEEHLQALRRHIAATIRKAGYQVLRLRDLVNIAKQERLLVTELDELVQQAADTGVAPAADKDRLTLTRTQAIMTEANAVHHQRAAIMRLSSAMGLHAQAITRLTDSWNIPDKDPHLTDLVPQLDQHPSIVALRRQAQRAAADGAAAEAAAIPDLDLGLGGKYFADQDDIALVLQVNLPLPTWDRKRDAWQASAADRRRWLYAAEAKRIELQGQVHVALHDLRAARDEAQILRQQAIPAADNALAAAQKAYASGSLAYEAVISAQRDKLQQERQLVERRSRYWQAMTRLQFLCPTVVLKDVPDHSLHHEDN